MSHRMTTKRQNRTILKVLPWAVGWILVLALCLIAAVLTRASYTDYMSNQDAFVSLPYWHGTFSAEEIDNLRKNLSEQGGNTKYLDPKKLIDDTDTIIECTFTGQRSYSYEAFLSKVSVTKVLKGDQNLANTTISLYEPMSIWIPEKIEMRKSNSSKIEDTYMFGATMMAQSESYVLFLEKRQYPQGEDRAGKSTEYVICKSPFAKLGVQLKQNPETSVVSTDDMSLEKSLQYDILARDLPSAQYFFATRYSLLKDLKLTDS